MHYSQDLTIWWPGLHSQVFFVGVGLRISNRGHPWLFFIFMDLEEQPRPRMCLAWEPQNYVSAFAGDVVLLATWIDDPQHALESSQLSGKRISTYEFGHGSLLENNGLLTLDRA